MLDRLRELLSRREATAPHLDPIAEAAMTAFLARFDGHTFIYDPLAIEEALQILALDKAQRAAITCHLMRRVGHKPSELTPIKSMLARLLRRQSDFDEQAVDDVVVSIVGLPPDGRATPVSGVVGLVEAHAAREGIGPGLQQHLAVLQRWYERSQIHNADYERMHQRIGRLLGQGRNELGRVVSDDEPWGHFVVDDLSGYSPEHVEVLIAILTHAASASGARPSAKWLKAAQQRLEVMPASLAEKTLVSWLDAASALSPTDKPPFGTMNGQALKGLVWICALWPSAEVSRTVCELAIFCFKKLPEIGARSNSIGNACIVVLGTLGLDGVVGLTRVRSKVRYATANRLIEKALDAAAEAQGLGREDIEDIAVPAIEFDYEGILRRPVGEYVALVSVQGAYAAQLNWVDVQGRAQKSVPASVTRDHPEALKAIKQLTKEVPAILAAQIHRLESAYLQERRWAYAAWKTRLIDHPLLGLLGRRLIWCFEFGGEVVSAMLLQEGLTGCEGRPASAIPADARVRLWHPIDAPVAEVRAWRELLVDRGLTQPFKQAHREVYLLTPAERETGTYSNRFAAHILRQHQLAALCRERGWGYTLQGQWDSGNDPVRHLAERGLDAHLYLTGTGEDQVSQAGIFVYVGTDQVCFSSSRRNTPLTLEEVPPLVFSEIMRDVDLFVGVCSIGNDPNWNDSGDARYAGYWREASFGELSVTAQTRRDVLAQLIPKLAISDRVHLEGRFLHVRGDLHCYKIHLGSANVLMSPNDCYLCIVEGRGQGSGRGGPLFLPFEGDHRLAVILSKAMLLANDTKIKEESIRQQIGS